MAVGIGGISCSLVSGDTAGLTERVETWEVAGMNGHGAHLLGNGNSRAAFVGVLYDTAANVETWFNAIELLVGTSITIEDDKGRVHPTIRGGSYILVTRVSQPKREERHVPGSSVDTRGEIRVEGVVV